MPWLGISLELDAAAAEAFGDALLEAGVQSVSLDHPDAPRPVLHAVLARDADAAALVARVSASLGLTPPHFSVREIADEDWVRKTQAQFTPIEIGRRLWVGPSWHEPPPDRVAVRLDPGLAFGTGTHPTTQLVLRFLEQRLRGGEHLLDYGCGSGILAIAAAKLGAAHVDGVDVDPQAVDTAAANARANGVALRVALPDGLAPESYDIVVSNILAQPLIILAPLLAGRTAPGGQLALSGILESQAGEVAAAYAGAFHIEVPAVQDGWALLAGVRR